MTTSEVLVAFAVFSVVVSHTFHVLKWLYGLTKASHERYRTTTLMLLPQELKDSL